MKSLALLFLGALPLAAQPLLTFNNRPLGSVESPLVINSYLPDPGIDEAVFARHHKGLVAPAYSPKEGRDTKGTEKPDAGLPAAIAVSMGPQLAYVFDPVECRPMYAWQGGFLDFTPYWGDEKRGSRVSKDYVPRLVGTLFYKAEGEHPLSIGGKPIREPEYIGYSLEKGVPRFEFKAGGHVVKAVIRPAKDSFSYEAEWTCDPPAKLAWKEGSFTAEGEGKMLLAFTGKSLGDFHGYEVKVDLSKANVEAGATLFNAYGCSGCHSTDGSKGYGPSLAGLADTMKELEGSAEKVKADAAYLFESIKNPNAKVAKGYPPNYMPPYQLKDVEINSLVLFIQSIAKPE
ncbi:MAG: cytochrome c [Akkermansiaceae bacterium]|nr:cytochrome c [Akkermansiaceae bacterium]